MKITGNEEIEWSWNGDELWYEADVKDTVFLVISSEVPDIHPFNWAIMQDGDVVQSGTDETVYGCRFAAEDAFRKLFRRA